MTDVETVLEQIEKLSPEARSELKRALVTRSSNGGPTPTSERVQRFDDLMAKMPALPKNTQTDVTRESIYD